MKKIAIFTLGLMISAFAVAQNYKVRVTDKDFKVDKISRTGLAVTLEADKKLVENMWKKEFKNFGKSSSSGKADIIDQANIPQISSRTVRAMSIVESSGSSVLVWMAVDMGDTWVQSGTKGHTALEQLLHDFGKEVYRTIITEEIEAAEKALEKTVKDQEKIIKEGTNLLKEFDNNAEEKIMLETKLEENATQKIELEKSIEQNKLDQDEAANQVAEKEKAVQIVKDKLNQVD